jgi:hypothetical protein
MSIWRGSAYPMRQQKTAHFIIRKQYSKNCKTALFWLWKCGVGRKMRGEKQVKIS